MKKLYLIVPLALILCFMVGCQDKEAMAELEAMKAQAAVEEQNKELVRNFYAQLDAGNLAVVDEAFAPTCVSHYPGNVDLNGPEGYKKNSEPFLTGLPDVKHIIEDMIAIEDKIVVRFTIPATHTGEFQGIAPTGNEVKFTAIGIYRISDGKIVELWVEFDALGLMMQLGMELKPKQGEE